MARELHRLSPTAVQKAKKPGMYADGGGLYLQVTSAGARSWIFRYASGGREREMGLGSLAAISLAAARQRAADAREIKARGLDPIEARAADKAAAEAEKARQVTFEDAATRYVSSHKAAWRNAKHATQWTNTLKAYAYPIFGSIAVQDVDTGLVLKALEPIWTTKTETATRVRQRIESILDWAKSRGHRTGENAARWRGHLDNLLPKPSKVKKVRHHPALPYAEVGDFTKRVRAQEGLSARALELAILTASRTSEIIGLKWSEIDLEKKLWIVPANRIKAEREHRVPLSGRTGALLESLLPLRRDDDYVFPADKKGKHLSNGAMLALLDRMGRSDITTHGFRSTFKDWATECTGFPSEVSEMALAHAVKDKTEAAYRRGDLFEKRRKLMDAWATYCGKPSTTVSDVVEIGTARKRREGK
jgi:integrase